MIYVVAGLPGPFTRWCAEVLATIVAASGRSVVIDTVCRLADLAPIALETDADDIVCVATTADAALVDALERGARPFLIALDEPLAALARLSATDRPEEALCRVSAACASASSLATSGRATQVTRLAAEGDPHAAMAQIAACFGLQAAAVAPPPIEAASPSLNLPVRMESAMTAALAAYPQGLFSPRGGPIVLSDSLFLQGAPPHAPVSGPIEVTGRPGFLFFGPYLCLPIGDWDLSVYVDLSETAAGGHYCVDAVMSRDGVIVELANIAFIGSAPGLQEVRLAIRVEAPDHPLEFRMRTLRAMFDGVVTLVRVELRRRESYG